MRRRKGVPDALDNQDALPSSLVGIRAGQIQWTKGIVIALSPEGSRPKTKAGQLLYSRKHGEGSSAKTLGLLHELDTDFSLHSHIV